MPYFIYRLGQLGVPECLDSAPGYRDAKALLRAHRERDADDTTIRMIFADNEIAAVDLLTTPREPPPPEGDDE